MKSYGVRRLSSVVFPVVVAAAVLSTGCAQHARTARFEDRQARNLLFAPDDTGLATRDVPRADWPATTVFDDTGEDITYREWLTDTQGLTATSQDFTYRRFTSKRTGVRRR